MRLQFTRIRWIRHTNPQRFESALQSGNFWTRYESGIVRTLNPDFFRWRNKMEPSSLPWILSSRWQPRSQVLSFARRCILQDANFVRFTTHALLPIFPEESWVLEWIQIRVGYVWTGKFHLNTDTCRRGNFWPERKSCRFKNIWIREDASDTSYCRHKGCLPFTKTTQGETFCINIKL